MNTELRDAWIGWLCSQPWSYFLTVTFKEPVHRHRAISTLYFLRRSLNEFQPHCVFLGAEEHVSRYLHIHGLMCNRLTLGKPGNGPAAIAVWDKLRRVYGRTKVEVVRDAEDAVRYVTKYCVKGLAEYSCG